MFSISKLLSAGAILLYLNLFRGWKEDRTKGQYAYADKHIGKPTGKEELIRAVKSLLETHPDR
jgi:DNA-binding response OmpR family regulator